LSKAALILNMLVRAPLKCFKYAADIVLGHHVAWRLFVARLPIFQMPVPVYQFITDL
jgi:hypothetical protein